MHVALICPFSTGPARGNITTVQRIAAHLPAAGCRVSIVSLDTLTEQEQGRALAELRPDLLHGFHAFHAGPVAEHHARMLKIPYLVTITGSDLFSAPMCEHPQTRRAVANASAITCFDDLIAERFVAAFPDAAEKTVVIPQGVSLLPEAAATDNASYRPPGATQGSRHFVILLPAAIRPAKGILEALEALAPLADVTPTLRFVIAGGDLDAAYGTQIREYARHRHWVNLLGDVPHHLMGTLYTAADLVLNSSRFEGGMPNALLEAMAQGKLVVARDIAGNRSLIRHGETGWFFSTDEELRTIIAQVHTHQEHWAAIGKAARDFVRKNFPPEQEARQLSTLYGALTQLQ